MSGKRRVVWVGEPNIRLTLQAKLQRTALLPEGIGESTAKRPAKRGQGLTGER